jgi:hypothetical protein
VQKRTAEFPRVLRIGTLSASCLASLREGHWKKGKAMKTQLHTEPKATGTMIGATVSLALVIAFAVSSFVSIQKEPNPNAGNRTNSAFVVSAYLA